MSNSDGRFYEEDEAEEILRLALRQSSSGAIDRTRLLAMATELGISEEAIARAEMELAASREREIASQAEIADRAEFKRHKRRELWSNISSYFGVNGFLVAMWWFTGQGYFWPFWVLAAWGIGLVTEIASMLVRPPEREFQRWRERRSRKARRRLNDTDAEAILTALAVEMPGQKLKAINELRERLSLDITAAKELVDDYDARHGSVFDRTR